jgi:hypothetical protein
MGASMAVGWLHRARHNQQQKARLQALRMDSREALRIRSGDNPAERISALLEMTGCLNLPGHGSFRGQSRLPQHGGRGWRR